MTSHLEFDANTSAAVLDAPVTETHMPEDASALVKEGVAAAQRGDRESARTLLTRAAGLDPQCEDAWMWLASISEYPEELLAFLNNVLSINPQNQRAVEWHSATRSLLARTFVQRGVAAHDEGSTELADSFFDQALGHDDALALAWLWKARLAASDEQKVAYLERALEIDPENAEANEAIAPFRGPTPEEQFEKAKWAAVAGRRNEAMQLLDEVLEKTPENAEAWILRSHFSLDLNDKLTALEKALDIEPENHAARAGYDFLKATVSGTQAHGEVPGEEGIGEMESVEEAVAELSETEMRQGESPDELSAEVSNTEDEPAAAETDDEPAEGPAAVEAAETPREAEVEVIDVEASASPFDEVAVEPNEEEISAETAAEVETEGRTLEEILGAVHDHADPETATVESIETSDVVEFFSDQNGDCQPVDDEPTVLFDTAAEFVAEPEVVPVEPEVAEYSETPQIVEQPDAECLFCQTPVFSQAFECGACHAVLSLSDIEALLANANADYTPIQQAVTRMEAEWNTREFSVDELTVLGIGHFNLHNFDDGFKYLQEASRLDPNNVILGGQVNALAIRLDEIRRQDEIDGSKPKGKSILVVDDSATVRKLISAKLEKSGHNVTCAADGVEGLEKLAVGLPDLVLLDIAMPRMDGYEVCKQIRANPAAAGVPIVMISGKDGFFDKVRGKMAGCTGYVTKPFGPETLMKALETYLRPENGLAE